MVRDVYSLPSLGRYCWLSKDKTIEYPNLGEIRFILYGAESYYGLIGPEQNGIAILSEYHSTVLCDRILKCDTGSFGPTLRQFDYYKTLVQTDETQLVFFLNNHRRSRVHIWDPTDFKNLF